ncbi:MAG: AAA family ATPase [Acidimicrobiaceae bacterium]|nr:AAA family ATPase [Acidimicrobiaceae bacterium]MYE43105.1 AAA family ATPase [Acidobacteriota bacterium]MDE0666566.1 AAA family ATPase [Acidimicrobiaceae bacterium]MXW88950.1 AAA family ATPase [Acidimicrobiaceae bacterium]MYA13899.1 AAA family ATPase [Acidimicrobiaceae bacterium]
MKIGVVGKGGVGKTTLSALLARSLADRGRRVLAVDTDSNPNLGLSLGLDSTQTEALPTVPRSIVVGSRGDLTVAELMADYAAATPSGVAVMSALRVTEAAAGCTCGGHATVRSLLGEALDTETDDTIVDMEAGIEHLSRSGGTLAHADVLVLVMEPSLKAVITARRTITLARELGIGAWIGVGNKVGGDHRDLLARLCADNEVPLDVVVPLSADVVEADRLGTPLAPGEAGSVWTAVESLTDRLMEIASVPAPQ